MNMDDYYEMLQKAVARNMAKNKQLPTEHDSLNNHHTENEATNQD